MSVELPSMNIERIREALADPALFDEGASVDDTLRACERWHAANSPEAIRELLAERDALKADAERLRAERDELARQFEPMGEPTSPDELIARLHAECAEDEAIKRDAQRYRWLRGREDGRYMTVYAFRTDVDEVCLGEELDATIDAARGASNE